MSDRMFGWRQSWEGPRSALSRSTGKAVRGLDHSCGLVRIRFAAALPLLRLLRGLLDLGFSGVERTHARRARNEEAVKCLKTNNPAKSLIRRSIMISMTYDPRRETARFAMRNIRFVFVCFGLRRRRKAKRASRVRVLGEPRIAGRSVIAPKARKSRSGSRSIHPIATGLEAAARKKLRKRAAKPMKSLARVNLCADAVLYGAA